MDKRSWVLHYSNRVEVLEPESLRERVVVEHEKASRVYE